jgi:glycosyltransferase involved in cell wall biosynthesis
LTLPAVTHRRVPARVQQLLAPLGVGVETWTGPLDVFQHTDLVFPPVSAATEVLTLHDVCFLDSDAWHDPGFRRRVEPRLRRCARRAGAVIVPSRRTADAVVRHGLTTADRVHVIPLGVDHIDPTSRPDDEARLRAGLAAVGHDVSGELLVLLPGTREPRKNQLAVVRAFLSLAPGAARLVMIGPRGWRADELESLLRQPDVRRRVAVLGPVSEDDLQAWFRTADLVVYPSLAEGFGLPVAEAMRCGRAVLTSRATPMADLGGEAVVAVDAGDETELRSALAALLEDEPRREALGVAAAERVATLTWDAAATALEQVYRDVANSRHEPRLS